MSFLRSLSSSNRGGMYDGDPSPVDWRRLRRCWAAAVSRSAAVPEEAPDGTSCAAVSEAVAPWYVLTAWRMTADAASSFRAGNSLDGRPSGRVAGRDGAAAVSSRLAAMVPFRFCAKWAVASGRS